MQIMHDNFAITIELLFGGVTPTSLAVAVSGGTDSMALTLLLQEYCATRHITLHALHVDHQLRKESTQEATQVQAWLSARGMVCSILTPTTPIASMQGNKMQNARQVRYQLMQDYCSTHGITYLCTAHHQEDQAETLLMRLGRGCGVEGLAGMRPVSERDSIILLRPLLDIPKARLKAYLESCHQPWIEDPTNHHPDYTRTKMRHLLPTLEQEGISAKRIGDVAAHMARAADFLQAYTHAWLAEQGCMAGGFYAALPVQSWSALHPEMQLRTLRAALEALTPLSAELRFSALDGVRQAMLQSEEYKTRNVHGCIVIKYRSHFLIGREVARLPNPTPLQVGEEMFTFGTLGKKGVAQLKAASLSLPRLPYMLLMTIPALWHLDEVIAVPHIKYIHPAWEKLTYHLHNALESRIDDTYNLREE